MSQQRTVVVNNIKYVIKNKNDIIENTLLEGKQWNNKIVLTIGSWIKKYSLQHLFNAGCHIGTVALPLSRYIDKVTAVEPFPPTYKHFQENMKINRIKNIDSFNLALGDKEDKVYFLDPNHIRVKNNSGGIHAITELDIEKNQLSSNLHVKSFSNSMKKIDNLNIEKFDIMLLDVEGREYEVIKGGINKISNYKPILIVEIWKNSKRQEENMKTSEEDVINYVLGLGYKLINKLGDNYFFFPKDFKI